MMEDQEIEPKTMRQMVREMHTVMMGNPTYKQEGLIDQVKKNTRFRRAAAYIVGFFTGIGIALGFLWDKILQLFTF